MWILSSQALTFEEQAAVPTCNLSEIVHNKWLQASRNKMVELYSATVDDYSRAVLQSIAYFNFLKGGRFGTSPSTSVLRLRVAARIANPSRVAKAVEDVSCAVGLNTRVPHLEGEKVFGSAKRKLELPPGDASDSHRYDRVNYSIPKLSKTASPFQCRSALSGRRGPGGSGVAHGSTLEEQLTQAKCGSPIIESSCADSMAWRIERISPTSSVLCSGHSANGLKCNAKIAKYRHPVAAPTFNGIQHLRKSRETEQMQFWFCPRKFQACIKDSRSRSIVHFPALPLVWPIMSGTNLT